MREELNIYINGKPYVLREDERPFKNMQARRNLSVPRLRCRPVSLLALTRRAPPHMPCQTLFHSCCKWVCF